MPGRTKPPDRVSIDLPRNVRDQLTAYKAALERDFQRRATVGEILSAMLQGVPKWQTLAMLDAHRPSDNTGSTEGDAET